jgi:hypothetical protein
MLIKKDDGQEQLIPIVDVTRRWQLVLMGGALAGSLLIWFGKHRR